MGTREVVTEQARGSKLVDQWGRRCPYGEEELALWRLYQPYARTPIQATALGDTSKVAGSHWGIDIPIRGDPRSNARNIIMSPARAGREDRPRPAGEAQWGMRGKDHDRRPNSEGGSLRRLG